MASGPRGVLLGFRLVSGLVHLSFRVSVLVSTERHKMTTNATCRPGLIWRGLM